MRLFNKRRRDIYGRFAPSKPNGDYYQCSHCAKVFEFTECEVGDDAEDLYCPECHRECWQVFNIRKYRPIVTECSQDTSCYPEVWFEVLIEDETPDNVPPMWVDVNFNEKDGEYRIEWNEFIFNTHSFRDMCIRYARNIEEIMLAVDDVTTNHLYENGFLEFDRKGNTILGPRTTTEE